MNLPPLYRLATRGIAHAVLLAIALGLGGCGEGGRTAQQHLARAQEYRDSGELNAAVIELKNALQKNPDLAEARWLLGRTYLRTGDGPGAVKELERAQEAGFEHPELQTTLLQALLLAGEYDEVLERAPGLGSPETTPRLLALRAEALLGVDRLEEAREHFREAVDQDPEAIEAHLGLARIALLERRLENAAEHLDTAVGIDEENIHVWLLRGEVHLARKAPAEAAAAYRRAEAITAQNPYVKLGLARALLAQNEPGKAIAPLSELQRLYPDLVAARYLRALAAYQQGDRAKAREILQKILSATGDHAQSLLLLGNIYLQEGQLEQAEEFITRFNAAVPGYAPAIRMLAATQLQREKPDAAIETLGGLREEGAAAEDYALLGTAYVRQGDFTRGTEYLEKAATGSAKPAALRTQLALGHLAAGATDKAISELETAMELDPGFMRAEIVLVYTYLREGSYDKALEVSRNLAKKHADSPIPHNLSGAAHAGKEDFAAARAAFEQALEIDPRFTPAMINLASLDFRDEAIERGRQRLERVVEIDEGNLQAHLVLARLAARDDDLDKMVSHLERAREANPQAARPRLMLARYHLQQAGDVEQALALAEEAVQVAPEQPDALMVLGQVQNAANRPREALETFQRVTEAVPNAPQGHLQLARVQARLDRLDEARASLQRALELQPEFLPAMSSLASVELRAGNHERALELAREVQSAHADSPEGHALEGDVLMAQDRARAAVDAYEAAFDRMPTSVLAVKLHQAHMRSGDADAAYRELESWLAEHPDDVPAKLTLAGSRQSAGEDEAAIAAYRDVLENQPDNVVALNNLAWLYHEAGNPEALDLARRAQSLAPGQPQVLDTLGWILVRSGRVERGLEYLQRALDQAPGSRDIRYHYAAALAETGARERALEELRKAMSAQGPFTEQAKAEALLSELE